MLTSLVFLQQGNVEKSEKFMKVHSSNPSPPFTKGGIDFLKFGNKGGDEVFFLEREGLD